MTQTEISSVAEPASDGVVLEARKLTKYFWVRPKRFGPRAAVHAVEDVSIRLGREVDTELRPATLKPSSR